GGGWAYRGLWGRHRLAFLSENEGQGHQTAGRSQQTDQPDIPSTHVPGLHAQGKGRGCGRFRAVLAPSCAVVAGTRPLLRTRQLYSATRLGIKRQPGRAGLAQVLAHGWWDGSPEPSRPTWTARESRPTPVRIPTANRANRQL